MLPPALKGLTFSRRCRKICTTWPILLSVQIVAASSTGGAAQPDMNTHKLTIGPMAKNETEFLEHQ